MRLVVLALAVLSTLVFAVSVFAVSPEKTIEYTESPMGKVVFDGKTHNAAVKSCSECHNADVFPEMRMGAVSITMNDINSGKYCGACHNGNVTFSATGNCMRCHKQ